MRLIDCVYHSTLGLRVIEKKKKKKKSTCATPNTIIEITCRRRGVFLMSQVAVYPEHEYDITWGVFLMSEVALYPEHD